MCPVTIISPHIFNCTSPVKVNAADDGALVHLLSLFSLPFKDECERRVVRFVLLEKKWLQFYFGAPLRLHCSTAGCGALDVSRFSSVNSRLYSALLCTFLFNYLSLFCCQFNV